MKLRDLSLREVGHFVRKRAGYEESRAQHAVDDRARALFPCPEMLAIYCGSLLGDW